MLGYDDNADPVSGFQLLERGVYNAGGNVLQSWKDSVDSTDADYLKITNPRVGRKAFIQANIRPPFYDPLIPTHDEDGNPNENSFERFLEDVLPTYGDVGGEFETLKNAYDAAVVAGNSALAAFIETKMIPDPEVLPG